MVVWMQGKDGNVLKFLHSWLAPVLAGWGQASHSPGALFSHPTPPGPLQLPLYPSFFLGVFSASGWKNSQSRYPLLTIPSEAFSINEGFKAEHGMALDGTDWNFLLTYEDHGIVHPLTCPGT